MSCSVGTHGAGEWMVGVLGACDAALGIVLRGDITTPGNTGVSLSRADDQVGLLAVFEPSLT